MCYTQLIARSLQEQGAVVAWFLITAVNCSTMEAQLVWLSSNVVSKNGVKNTPSEFTTYLPTPLKLEGKRKAGIAQIMFTKSWYNITKPQLIGIDSKEFSPFFKTLLEPGHYEDMYDLATKINNKLAVYSDYFFKLPKVYLNRFNRRCEVKPGLCYNHKKVYPCFGDQLSTMLGYDSRDIDKHFISDLKADDGEYINLVKPALRSIPTSVLESIPQKDPSLEMQSDAPPYFADIPRQDYQAAIDLANDAPRSVFIFGNTPASIAQLRFFLEKAETDRKPYGDNVSTEVDKQRVKALDKLIKVLRNTIDLLEPYESNQEKYGNLWNWINHVQTRKLQGMTEEDRRVFDEILPAIGRDRQLLEKKPEEIAIVHKRKNLNETPKKPSKKPTTTDIEKVNPVIKAKESTLITPQVTQTKTKAPPATVTTTTPIINENETRKPTDVRQVTTVPPKPASSSKSNKRSEGESSQIVTQNRKVIGETTLNIPSRTSLRSFDLQAGIHSLFVYCDILKNAIVGDSYSPLLRAIEIPNRPFGTDCAIQFQEIFYQPINFRQIDSITISLRDDTNTLIDFKFGKTLLLLLLKKDE